MKFDKTKFDYSGKYLSYKGKFVARFKYSGMLMAPFKKFLIKNFTEEEYFIRLSNPRETPMGIMESKGYTGR
jgi:hypothetical protein